jgi:hypothetical protein
MTKINNSLVVKALPHTPPYKIHRYFARRPWNVFEALVNQFTKPGDVVLDPFMGGGTTIYEASKLGRAAIGCDLNPLSVFIVEAMFLSSGRDAIKAACEMTLDALTPFEGPVQLACSQCGNPGRIEWCELVHTVECPNCSELCKLSEDQKVAPGRYRCPNQNCSYSKGFAAARVRRGQPHYKYSVVKCATCSNTWTEEFSDWHLRELGKIRKALQDELAARGVNLSRSPIPREWDRQHEDLLFAKGFEYFEDLFTHRNLLELLILKSEIQKKAGDPEVYRALRFAFSDSLRDVNVMSFTNSSWQAGKPTTWSKHAYWTPSEFCEVSVSSAFRKSVQSLIRSIEFNSNNQFQGRLVSSKRPEDLAPSEAILHSGSVTSLDLGENSVDAVITDPPYGSNVQYAELSHFWYPWNKDLYRSNPDFKLEAVVNRKQGFEGAKTYSSYEANLAEVFSASFKALKSRGILALTFNNKDLRAWVALLAAITKSGFRYIPNSVYFQDGVANYRQTAHTRFEGSPFGDFVYVFEKSPEVERKSPLGDRSLNEEISRALKTANGLLERGNPREAVMTGFYNQLVILIQDYIWSDAELSSESIYQMLLGSELGIFYKKEADGK